MSIQEFCRALPPPSRSFATDGDSWEIIEKQLGGLLPEDYRQFVSLYGTGAINEFIWVYSPFSDNKYLNLFWQSESLMKSFKIRRDEFGEELPFRLFPDENGVFPWGVTENGDHLCWRFREKKFAHPLVIIENRGSDLEEFDVSMTTFLADLVCHRISVRVFPDEFLFEHPSFVSKQ